jgi:hypothetical protein
MIFEPNVQEKYRGKTLWNLFKEWLCTHFKKGEELIEAYAEAKVEKEKSQAKKTAEETAEIAAKRDTELARKRLIEHEEMQRFNVVVDDIFKEDGLPDEAKVLKFAKLIEKNHSIVAQVEEAIEVMQKLRLVRGVNIGVLSNPKKLLTDGEERGSRE